MALPAGFKSCLCSPGCSGMVPALSRWRYVRGHSPDAQKKRNHKPVTTSFVSKSGAAYSACIASLEVERDVIASEIDRLETQAEAAERTARAARQQSSDAAVKHEAICDTITNLKLLLGIIPKEA